MGMRNLKFTEHLGNKIRKFLKVDQSNLLVPSKPPKLRVDYNFNKPLRRGLMLKLGANCRGLGKPRALDNLWHIFWRCKPSLVFLSKTKLFSMEMKRLVDHLQDFEGVYVDSRDCLGGLALLWKKGLFIHLLYCPSNHIDVIVKWKQDGEEWKFIGIYGFLETHNKLKTCELLLDLKTHCNLPWLLGVA